MKGPKIHQGFTLIEVLVALVIVAFGMGAVLAALSSAADSTSRLREKTLAEWIGFNQISTIRLGLTAAATGQSAGEVEFASDKWRWSQLVEDTEFPGVRSITVRVRRIGAESTATTDEDADADWLATTVGFRGDAVNAASGELPDWNGTAFSPAAGGQQDGGGRGGRGGEGGEGNGGVREGERIGGPRGGGRGDAPPPPADPASSAGP